MEWQTMLILKTIGEVKMRKIKPSNKIRIEQFIKAKRLIRQYQRKKSKYSISSYPGFVGIAMINNRL